MRRNKFLATFAIMAGTFLLILVLPGSTPAVGTCHSPKGCPCTKEQEKQGMKTVGGNCVDCARNAKELDNLRKDLESTKTEIEKWQKLADESAAKADSSWHDVQESLPHFSDAVRGYVDLSGRVLRIANAIRDSSSSGPYVLSNHLATAHRDLSQITALAESPLNVGRLVGHLIDSVRYVNQTWDANDRLSNLDTFDIHEMIDEHLEVKAKCDGKKEKKSEQKSLENPGIYIARLPELLRLVASSPSATNPNQSPCRGSRENLKRCEEAQQVLSDVRGLDLPETNVAFREVLRILEPFGRDNADKIADQEVRQRAKEADAALKILAEHLDRLVSRSKKALALLQGGGA